ncbi:type II secretion system secretin GspD [Ottowia flava]|uniref:Type II secretion system secretin GspD n=1 Tax=Ottowia flava TaxID=2675430 RepID=A0ABW4KUU4_9BURK|nr:type II secretion system secretin GspD [Ottowia sp. GY511]
MARARVNNPFSAASQPCLRCLMHHVLKHWGQTATAVTLLGAATMVNAQAAISAITGLQKDGRDAVRIEFNGATDVSPSSFLMQSPPRIAIDLPGIQTGNMASTVPLAQGNIKGIRLAAAGDRTRMVLELAEAANVRTSREGNALLLTLEPDSAASTQPAVVLAQAKTGDAPAPEAAPRKRAAATPESSKESQPTARGNVTLDFANAEIDAVARTMATITGSNVVVDPRVKGTMTLTSTTPVSPAQAMRLFSTQLRTQGFALVESNGMYVVLPEAEAKLQSSAVSAGTPRATGGQIVTQIFRLTHENANNLVPVLRPLISPNNTINVNASTNSLVITDYADNLQRLARIISSLDVSNATGVEVVRLRYAVASDLAPLVARLLESGGSGTAITPQGVPGQPNVPVAAAAGANEGYRTTLVPEPRSNAIIVRAANPARLALAKTLIEQLDQPPTTRADGGSGNIFVVYLKNADATKLAVTLRAALAALPGQSNAGAGGAGGGAMASAGGLSANQGMQSINNAQGASGGNSLASGPTINAAGNNQPSTGGQIQADPATNSLIISAPEPVYRELRAVIDKLDQRRAQVFVESLIAEVRADRAADFGIQWQALGRHGSTVGVVGTNYRSPSLSEGGAVTPNIFDFAAQFLGANRTGWKPTMAPGTGFNLLLGSNALGIMANFIQSTGAGNVLSTPTLLTLDNEEAKFIVGQNVPMVTGSYTNTGSNTNSVNPFQTYDRKDVGLTLRVRPQISEDGTIKLVIYQETSNVVPGTLGNQAGPTTNKRAIESSVLVNDGGIVALGGLMEDAYQSTEDKVPVLGDVPVVGNLFKTRGRSLSKTNLMVFLRPVIVRDAPSTESYSLDRYEMMRATQQATQPEASVVLPINPSSLPPAVPARPEAWSRPAPPPPMINPIAGEGSDYSGTTFTRP